MGDRVPLENVYKFTEDQEVKKIEISVRRDNNYLDSIVMRDANEDLIVRI